MDDGCMDGVPCLHADGGGLVAHPRRVVVTRTRPARRPDAGTRRLYERKRGGESESCGVPVALGYVHPWLVRSPFEETARKQASALFLSSVLSRNEPKNNVVTKE